MVTQRTLNTVSHLAVYVNRLQTAINNGDHKLVEKVLGDSQIDPLVGNLANGTIHYRPLHHAAEIGNSDIVGILLDNGAHIDVKDPMGNTALIMAASGRHDKVVDKLVGGGANVNIPNGDSDTPLTIAADRGSVKNVKLLISKGAYINHRNYTNMSAIGNALFGYDSPPQGITKKDYYTVANILVKNGAEINSSEAGAFLAALISEEGIKLSDKKPRFIIDFNKYNKNIMPFVEGVVEKLDCRRITNIKHSDKISGFDQIELALDESTTEGFALADKFRKIAAQQRPKVPRR